MILVQAAVEEKARGWVNGATRRSLGTSHERSRACVPGTMAQ